MFHLWLKQLVKICAIRVIEFSGVCCKTVRAMRILALDHGSKRIGVAVSDETKTIAQPLEYIPAEPFADFLARLKQLLIAKERAEGLNWFWIGHHSEYDRLIS